MNPAFACVAQSGAVRIEHVGGEPGSRARRISSSLRAATRGVRWELTRPEALRRIRRSVCVVDRCLRYTDPRWYYAFLLRRGRLGGVPVARVDCVTTGPEFPGAVLLYVHGGGFFFNIPGAYARLAAVLCARIGIRSALLPEYRLAPEHTAPAALDDLVAAYRTLLQRHPGSRVIMAGDSAGGGLLLSLLMHLRDAEETMPACAILLSPVTDLTLSGPSHRGNRAHDVVFGNAPDAGTEFYAGNTPIEHPSVSPLFGDFSGLPPILAQVGNRECLLDDSLRMQEGARKAGVRLTIEVWNGLPHVWQLLPLPESRAAIARIAAFARQQLQAQVDRR